ncbi:MAG: 50S ribosomal protein L23 [Bacteroidota bacterium]|jgi:large subunit ribosomal protein L23|nr:50S ribosomal protein L23 [Bacteroidota bacterium]
MRDVLIRPLITEKLTGQSEKLNRFGFVVSIDANKIEIKKAIEKMYGVTVKDVNTNIRPNKLKTRYTKAGQTKGMVGKMKKAYVTLAAGETIDFYSNI